MRPSETAAWIDRRKPLCGKDRDFTSSETARFRREFAPSTWTVSCRREGWWRGLDTHPFTYQPLTMLLAKIYPQSTPSQPGGNFAARSDEATLSYALNLPQTVARISTDIACVSSKRTAFRPNDRHSPGNHPRARLSVSAAPSRNEVAYSIFCKAASSAKRSSLIVSMARIFTMPS